jgi:hypothetical protein
VNARIPVMLWDGPFLGCKIILEVPTLSPRSLPGDSDDDVYPMFVSPPDRIVVNDTVYRRKHDDDGQWHSTVGAWLYELVP